VAVNNVSLSIGAGEVYSLVGANGAGKSTLIRMITALAVPDSGRLTICGEDLAHRMTATLKHVGYLPEELVLYDRLTGREYLSLVAALKEAAEEGVQPELDFFELTGNADKLIGAYSLGMRKKLGLAAAMIGAPDALVLDEPLNGLDVEMMRKFRSRIVEERRSGRSFLLSSHVMSFVERVSDRVGLMKSGQLIAEGTPADLRVLAHMPTEPFEDVFFQLSAP
jgi:ABC-2 type transport system ATP-binding protein